MNKTPRKKPVYREANLQAACKKWFDYQYPQYRKLFFKIKNDGYKTYKQGSRDKSEGIEPGVSDTLLAVTRQISYTKGDCRVIDVIPGMFVEFKIKPNKQTPEQKAFQEAVERQGYRYELIYDFDTFKKIIEEY